MILIIEHHFPLARFHATRWKQGAFGDPYGEWPPSPYRLLRALAMRWFQYGREMGWSNETEHQYRDSLLRPLLESLAQSLPSFYLPPPTLRGTAIKQYHPTQVEWTDKSKKAGAYKRAQTTLVDDHYRAVPSDTSLFWQWEDVNLGKEQETLLDRLLDRVLYFGRAESFCRMRRISSLPEGVEINCSLSKKGGDGMVPVLAAQPDLALDYESLLWQTSDKRVAGKPIPTGTAWFYAQLPKVPRPPVRPAPPARYPEGLCCMQFAVGGRVFPPLHQWVKVTERFRGRVIRELASVMAPKSGGRYDKLNAEQRNRLALICGKDENGKPLKGQRHAYFIMYPDENQTPTRLVVWRDEPFNASEIDALLKASEFPITWDDSLSQWKLRLVPLPFDVPSPQGLLDGSRVWMGATPFVPPTGWHRFRRNGRERPGESLERIIAKLLQGKAVINRVEQIGEPTWVTLHETRTRRFAHNESRTPQTYPGYWLRVELNSPIVGPLILGDSSHFGLGLFMPVKE